MPEGKKERNEVAGKKVKKNRKKRIKLPKNIIKRPKIYIFYIINSISYSAGR